MKIKDEVNRLRKLAFTEIELKKDDFKKICSEYCFLYKTIYHQTYNPSMKLISTWGRSKAAAQKPAEKFLKDEEPIITKKLKNKYVCPFPFPGCVRSEVCHVCCWECDKECKQCSNNPQLCGARRLK